MGRTRFKVVRYERSLMQSIMQWLRTNVKYSPLVLQSGRSEFRCLALPYKSLVESRFHIDTRNAPKSFQTAVGMSGYSCDVDGSNENDWNWGCYRHSADRSVRKPVGPVAVDQEH